MYGPSKIAKQVLRGGAALLLACLLCASMPVRAESARMLVPVGHTVGIKLFSDGVLVVGLSPVETEGGASYPGRDCGLKTGDVITHINGGEVDTIEEVQALVAQSEDEPLIIQAVRG